jgi:hypothetical protein
MFLGEMIMQNDPLLKSNPVQGAPKVSVPPGVVYASASNPSQVFNGPLNSYQVPKSLAVSPSEPKAQVLESGGFKEEHLSAQPVVQVQVPFKQVAVKVTAVLLILMAIAGLSTLWNDHQNNAKLLSAKDTESLGAQNSQANTLQMSLNGADLKINRNTTISNGKKLTATGAVAIQNEADSEAAFAVQNAKGANVLVVDTVNNRVGVGGAPTGGAALQILGDLSINGNIISADGKVSLGNDGLRIGSVLVCTARGCISSSSPSPTPSSPTIDVANVAYLNKNQTFNGSINTTSGFSVNGTAGSNITCPAGEYLKDPVVTGGLITGGVCNPGPGVAVATLQQVYDASNPGTLTLSTTNGLMRIQDALSPLATNLFEVTSNGGANKYLAVSSAGVSVFGNSSISGQYQVNGSQISSSNLSNDANLAKVNGNTTFTGNNSFQNAANSLTAFQIQNTAGTSNLFIADTINSQIGIAVAPGTYTLSVGGSINGTTIFQNGNQVCDTGGNCSYSSSSLTDSANIARLDANQTFTGINTFNNAGNSFTGDGTGVSNVDAAKLGGQAGSYYTNATNIGSGTLNDSRLSANVALLNANQSATGNKTFTGTVLVQNSSNSVNDFQIQDSAGTSNLFVADTTHTRIAIGQASANYPLDVAGDINSTTGIRVGGTLLCSAGGCLAASGSGSYIQNGTTVQTANQYTRSNAAGSVTGIFEGANGQSVDILDVQGYNGGTKYLAVNTNGISVAGNVNTSGQYQIGGIQISSANLSNDSNLAKLTGTGPQTFTGNNKFTGTVLAQNSSDSATAFQVQNAAGGNLINVDSTNSSISLIGNNPGQLSSWATSTNALPNARTEAASVVANGYMYEIGGSNGSGQSTVYYAKLNADGSTGTWATNTNALPAVRQDATAVAANGYLYEIGGSGQSTVYYAKLNADGSTGTWATNTNALPQLRNYASSLVANGYIYVIGGFTGSGQSTVYYAKLNADGSTAAWQTNVNALSGPRYSAGSAVANGYAYIIGGETGGGNVNTVLYAQLNSDGSTGTWTTNTNNLPANRSELTTLVTNGYIYALGGCVGSCGREQSTVYYAKLNADGSTGTWATNTNALPAARMNHTSVVANGYVYTIGGSLSGTAQTTVYYASTARLQIGANLDLVGLQGGNIADTDGLQGSVGGSITAGNITAVGALQVQGQGNFAQSVGIAGNLSVLGQATISNSTNSTSTFRVQNATGNNYIQVDTSGANLYLGNAGITSTVQVGNTTGAVAQTINIGTNATASSTSTVMIGSQIGTSSTTIQCGSGTCGIGNNATDHSTVLGSNTGVSTTTIRGGTGGIQLGAPITSAATVKATGGSAFQVQNSSATTFLNVDTTTSSTNTVAITTQNIASNGLSINTDKQTSGAGQIITHSNLSGGDSVDGIDVNMFNTIPGAASNSTVNGAGLNVNRNISTALASVNSPLLDTSIHNADSGGGPIGITSTITVGSQPNRYLLMEFWSQGSITIGSMTYNGTSMTLLGSVTSSNGTTYFYGLVAPASGTHNIVETTSSGSPNLIYVVASSWYNVDQATPVGTFTSSTGTSTTASLTASTQPNQVVVDGYIRYGEANGTPNVAQTTLENTNFYYLGSSYFIASGTSTPMSWTGTPAGRTYDYAAIPINSANSISPAAIVTGNLAQIQSNCTVNVGSCTDTSTLLKINQQYSGSTGTVLTVQNAGSGDLLNLNNASTTVLAVSSSGNVAFGNNANHTISINTSSSGNGNNLTMQAGTAAGGSNNGGDLLLQGGAATGSGTGGRVIVKAQTDSTGAFQVQNASGGSLINVDTANSIIKLTSLNTSTLGAWQTAVNLPPAPRDSSVTVTANGYLYQIGGGNPGPSTSVYYSKLNADGSPGVWTTSSNPLPQSLYYHSAVAVNGYVYVIGGHNGTVAQTAVYYAKLNADGSTGTWQTNTNALPQVRYEHESIAANGYVYVIGGDNGAAVQSTVYYAKLNADGSTGTWQTNTNALPQILKWESAQVANGYAYVLGGYGAGDLATVYYGKLNVDGSIGTWTTNTNALPQGTEVHASAVINGYIYTFGVGNGGGCIASNSYFAKLNANGSTGVWQNGISLPQIMCGTSVIANGYVYLVGVYAGAGAQKAVYYASVARIQVGGSLDLVGLNSQTLTDGGSGGSITAGDGMFVGSLQVQGASNLTGSLSVGGTLNVGGDAVITGNRGLSVNLGSTSTNAAISIDQEGTNDGVYVYNGNAGSSANGLTIETYSTGSGIQIFNHGSGNYLTLGTKFTLGSTGVATFKNSTDSSAAFQIQNAGGQSLVNVDTANSSITLNGLSSGALQTWQTSPNALPATRYDGGAVVANGYAYFVGGSDNTPFPTSTVYYSKLNADGSIGSWTTSANPLPQVRELGVTVAANGYLYYIGGDSGGGALSTAYYAKLNADGSTGAWQTSSNSLPVGRYYTAGVAANGYVYIFGGGNNTAYYAKLNADGSTGTWQLSGVTFPANVADATATVVNGYVYVIGGYNAGVSSTVYYSKLNADGSIGSWTTSANPLPSGRDFPAAISLNGYIYVIGGNSGTAQTSVYYAKVNSNGSTGSWTNNSNLLSNGIQDAGIATANGYVYIIGGYNGALGNAQNSVFYTSTSRLQIGSSIDLVGLGVGNLSDVGASGGSITAANITAVGNLQVQGAANFVQGVSISGNLNVTSSTGTLLMAADGNNMTITLGAPSATPVLLVLGNKNTSGDPSCTTGALYYNSNTNQFRACQNGGWGTLALTPAYTGSLPGSPYDGQEVYYQADAANGVIWHLRYNAGSASAYKWEYLGGGPLLARVSSSETTTGTDVDLTTVGPSVSVPLNGDYLVRYGSILGNANVNGTAQAYVYFNGSSDHSDGGIANTGSGSVAPLVSATGERTALSVNAGTVKLSYWSSGGFTSTFQNRWISITPIRLN